MNRPIVHHDSLSRALLLSVLGVIFLSGCLIDRIGGASSKQPEEVEQSASEPTLKLIDQAFDGINPERLVDYHTHVPCARHERRRRLRQSENARWDKSRTIEVSDLCQRRRR